MKRLLTAFAGLALALSVLLPAPQAAAQSVATAVNSTAFPLSSNVLFPARTSGRIALKCQNPATNDAVTITFASGLPVILNPGGWLAEVAPSNLRGRVEDGAITATGTSGQTLPCSDSYLQ